MKAVVLFIAMVFCSTYSMGQRDTVVETKKQEIPEGVTVTKTNYGTTIKGVYNGLDVYVQNPIIYPDNTTTKGCIQLYPVINGNSTTRIVTSTVLEIDLQQLKLKTGDEVIIEIRHGDCELKVLNLHVLAPGYSNKK